MSSKKIQAVEWNQDVNSEYKNRIQQREKLKVKEPEMTLQKKIFNKQNEGHWRKSL